MDHPITADSASRFEAYVEGLVGVIEAMRTGPGCCGITALAWSGNGRPPKVIRRDRKRIEAQLMDAGRPAH